MTSVRAEAVSAVNLTSVVAIPIPAVAMGIGRVKIPTPLAEVFYRRVYVRKSSRVILTRKGPMNAFVLLCITAVPYKHVLTKPVSHCASIFIKIEFRLDHDLRHASLALSESG